MKIHKIDDDKIYFIMDSGAYGSILRDDANKLIIASNLDNVSVDVRRDPCIIDSLFKTDEWFKKETE